jgi:hypothetical protein
MKRPSLFPFTRNQDPVQRDSHASSAVPALLPRPEMFLRLALHIIATACLHFNLKHPYPNSHSLRHEQATIIAMNSAKAASREIANLYSIPGTSRIEETSPI